jgi:hypothetical protein
VYPLAGYGPSVNPALFFDSALFLQTRHFWSGGGGIRTLDTPLRGITP